MKSDRSLLTSYRHALDCAMMYLGVGDRFTLDELLDALRRVYKRRIDLLPEPDMPLPFTGTTIVTSRYIAIFYRSDVPLAQQLQIICHEIVHILRDHNGYGSFPVGLAASVPLPSDGVLPEVYRMCSRTLYDQPDEYEAEYTGTYLKHKIISADPAITLLSRL